MGEARLRAQAVGAMSPEGRAAFAWDIIAQEFHNAHTGRGKTTDPVSIIAASIRDAVLSDRAILAGMMERVEVKHQIVCPNCLKPAVFTLNPKSLARLVRGENPNAEQDGPVQKEAGGDPGGTPPEKPVGHGSGGQAPGP